MKVINALTSLKQIEYFYENMHWKNNTPPNWAVKEGKRYDLMPGNSIILAKELYNIAICLREKIAVCQKIVDIVEKEGKHEELVKEYREK